VAHVARPRGRELARPDTELDAGLLRVEVLPELGHAIIGHSQHMEVIVGHHRNAALAADRRETTE
jgi:hypothetical protein